MYLTYASYPTTKVVSIDGNAAVSTASFSGFGTGVVYSAYRNADGSFYVCGLAANFAAYVPAGGGASTQLVAKACNYMAPISGSLYMSSDADWAVYRIGSAGTLPTTTGQTATAVGALTNSGGAQDFSWVLDDLGTTLFTCVPTGGGEYGVTRQTWSSGPSGAVTRIEHTSNIYCYAITGQVRILI